VILSEVEVGGSRKSARNKRLISLISLIKQEPKQKLTFGAELAFASLMVNYAVTIIPASKFVSIRNSWTL